MNDEQLAARLTERLREAFVRPTLTYHPTTQMRDIPTFNSINFVQMILALEEDFGIELHEDEVDSIYTMGDIFALLRGKVPED